MDHPLSTQMIFERGEQLFAQSSIASFDGTQLVRTSYAATAVRARRLAAALFGLGLGPGERVGSGELCGHEGLDGSGGPERPRGPGATAPQLTPAR